ncbi:Chemotaxis protein CheW [compost metagenome]
MIPFIIFKLQGKDFGIPFQEIEEIQNAKTGTPLPFSQPWHEGMITIRGDLFTLINLSMKLGLSDQKGTAEDKIILLSRYKVALLVNELDDTITAEEDEIAAHEDERLRTIFPTIIEKSGRSVPLLSVDALIASTQA